MIKKLMKYDIKKMTKILIYVYICSIVLGGITRLINIGKDIQVIEIIGRVFEGCTYSAIANILINTYIGILKVFAVNFYGDESYLTHTLPISKNKLLASKYLSSLVVIFSSTLVCFITLFIMFYSKSFMSALKAFVELTVSGFNMSAELFITLITLVLFAQICAIISMAFTAVVKANTYNSKRILKGLLWFALYYLGALVAIFAIAVIVFLIGGNLPELFASQLSQSTFIGILVIVLTSYVACAVLFYLICNRLFNKGVNVD